MAQVRVDLRDADGGLPEVCMCCGEQASEMITRRMSWTPPWIGFTWIVGGPILYIILALILTKRATIQAPLCDDHQNHWSKRNWMVWGSAVPIGLLVALLLILLIALPKHIQDNVGPFICIGSGGLGLVWLIGLIIAQSTAIRPKEITDYEITIDGVSDEFAKEMRDYERRRREGSRGKRKRRIEVDDDDEEEAPPPKKKKVQSEAIEEDRPRKKRPPLDDDEEERPRKKKPRRDDDDD